MLPTSGGPVGNESELLERQSFLRRRIRSRRRRLFVVEALENSRVEDALPARPFPLGATLLHLQEGLQDARHARLDAGERM